MAASSLTSNVDVNNCFSELSQFCKRNITTIKKLKKEIEKLKAEPEERVTTDKVNQWLRDLGSLEDQATSVLKNIMPSDTVKIGPWGGPGAQSFDCCRCVFRIIKVKIYTRDVVQGLEITYEDGITCPKGRCLGEPHEFELKSDDYINRVDGSFKGYDGEICIAQLQFQTKLGFKSQAFGPGGGKKFTVQVEDGNINGFFGQCNSYINSIGFCMGGSGNFVSVTFN